MAPHFVTLLRLPSMARDSLLVYPFINPKHLAIRANCMLIRLICATKDIEWAAVIARLLEAEEFQVEIVTRLLDMDGPSDRAAPDCTLVLWSRKSVNSWPVYDMARSALANRTLVQIALEPVKPELPSPHPPIDFRGWNGERSGAWRVLRERILQIHRGEEPVAMPIVAVGVLAAVSAGFVGLAVSDRFATGAAPDRLAEIEPYAIVEQQTETPRPIVDVGGPVGLEDELTAELDFTPARLRPTPAPRQIVLQALVEVGAAQKVAQMEIAEPGFLRSLLNGVEDTIPFINLSGDDGGGSGGGAPISIR